MFEHPSLGPVEPVGPRRLVVRLAARPAQPRFSICTMVTNWDQYWTCLGSYKDAAFTQECCEFLVLDNSERNQADAYVALNEFLQAARGEFIILTHQDVTLIDDGAAELEARLSELTAIHPAWGVCGNAGHSANDTPVNFLSHPFRDNHIEGGPFPAKVVSLDENFLVVRRLANLALSRDLSGFHHYGADLCTVADILGWEAYVIGFHLRHHSGGSSVSTYDESFEAIGRKYERALRPRWVHLLSERSIYISGNGAGSKRAHLLRSSLRVMRRARAIAGRLRRGLAGVR